MTEHDTLNLPQRPVSDFVSTDTAAEILGVGRKKVEAACNAYRKRMQQQAAEAPDPLPLSHELPCQWRGKRPIYLVYRPALTALRVNRPGETGRRGRKAGWRKPTQDDDLVSQTAPL